MSLTDAFNYVYKQVVPPQAPQAVPLKPLKPHTEISSRAPRGRTAVACTLEEVPAILAEHGADVSPIWPCGATVTGVDTTMPLSPRLAGALEVQMAHSGFVLLRGQGNRRHDSGISGAYLSGEQQCALSESFGVGALHSQHGAHHESPCREVFRLSNDAEHGFCGVGPEWHNDGSFCRDVFSHVVYHIVKAPHGRGDTVFAHLGLAHDALPIELQQRYRRCASVNSNGGVVHPLVFDHATSKRASLHVHLGQTGQYNTSTGAILERTSRGTGGIKVWDRSTVESFLAEMRRLLDRPDVSYSHEWREGDVVIIDNLAVAHKASSAAHSLDEGLRILHRTTVCGGGNLDAPAALELPLVVDCRDLPSLAGGSL